MSRVFRGLMYVALLGLIVYTLLAVMALVMFP